MRNNSFLGTPIQKLHMQINGNTIFMKRDDLIPFSFGGNKVRKAILFFDELGKEGSDIVVTYGSSSSNHCRIVANLAATKKMKCIIVCPQENNKPTYNSRMMAFFGAEFLFCPITEVKETIEKKMEELKINGNRPFFIPGGGHGNLGTWAYVEAYEEIRNYELMNNLYFDYIFHASGTGTTQAGLICGHILHHDQRRIVGISSARKNPYGSQVILDSVNQYLVDIGHENVGSEVVSFIDDFVLKGYGDYNHDILDTIKEVLIEEGVPLDTTYTGKAFWGMTKFLEKEQITEKNILFIHTGGTPLFFDDFNILEREWFNV